MSNINRSSNFRGSVDIYVTENESWLSESEQPLVTGLYKVADHLDKGPIRASMITEYRQLAMEVHKHKPVAKQQIKEETEETLDEFDKLVAPYKKDFG